jgi:hypothetical protein
MARQVREISAAQGLDRETVKRDTRAFHHVVNVPAEAEVVFVVIKLD